MDSIQAYSPCILLNVQYKGKDVLHIVIYFSYSKLLYFWLLIEAYTYRFHENVCERNVLSLFTFRDLRDQHLDLDVSHVPSNY
jgi:hypothetical protein